MQPKNLFANDAAPVDIIGNYCRLHEFGSIKKKVWKIFYLLLSLTLFYNCSSKPQPAINTVTPFYPNYLTPTLLPVSRFINIQLPKLKGLRLCLITNQASLGRLLLTNSNNQTMLHALMKQHQIKLYKIFTPEHGLTGQETAHGNSKKEKFYVKTIYLASVKKMAKMFSGCQTMVFDLPDAGVRPFTYRTIFNRSIQAMNLLNNKNKTGRMSYLMLDAPNPASYLGTIGPVARNFSYLGEEKIPFFPGYTFAEIALLYHSEHKLKIQFDIQPLHDYRSRNHFLTTGYPFQQPSPNLPTFRSVQCYWVAVFLEGSYLDIGRNSNDPFCLVGHPKFKHSISIKTLDDSISWQSYSYKPWGGRYKGKMLIAYRLRIENIHKYQPLRVAYNMFLHIKRRYKNIKTFRSAKGSYWLDKLIGSSVMRHAIIKGKSYEQFIASQQKAIRKFQKRIEPFVLYK